jgi:hypothetical protein
MSNNSTFFLSIVTYPHMQTNLIVYQIDIDCLLIAVVLLAHLNDAIQDV